MIKGYEKMKIYRIPVLLSVVQVRTCGFEVQQSACGFRCSIYLVPVKRLATFQALLHHLNLRRF